jgi:hypothetical protein
MKANKSARVILNSCDGKTRYNTKAESNKYVTNLNRTNGTKRVKTYYCPVCLGYHYGHQKQTRMKKNKQNHVADLSIDHKPRKFKGFFIIKQNF